ncbi:hypothetical protein [Nocardia araoensis]|nr:hypothetical protein [Nocardia araoensis]
MTQYILASNSLAGATEPLRAACTVARSWVNPGGRIEVSNS